MSPVRGSSHQANAKTLGCRLFGGGSQCTAIALAALILGSIILPGHWTRHEMDDVMREGDSLYRYLADTYFHGNHSVFIGHDQLPQNTTLPVFDSAISFIIPETFFGVIGQDGNILQGSTSLSVATHNALTLSHHALLTVNLETYGLMTNGTGMYIYDSHSRNSSGNVDPFGAAVLLDFTNIDEVIAFFGVNEGMPFEISPILFTHDAVQNEVMSHSQPISFSSSYSTSSKQVPSQITANKTTQDSDPHQKSSPATNASTPQRNPRATTHTCDPQQRPPATTHTSDSQRKPFSSTHSTGSKQVPSQISANKSTQDSDPHQKPSPATDASTPQRNPRDGE